MKVFIIAAITADGFIGRSSNHYADWTGTEDKKLFVKLTKEAGTMVMGATTFATIGRALPDRRNIIYTTKPETFKELGVETTNEPPAELVDRLRSEGVEALAICGGAQIYQHFMAAGVVDELYLTVVPKIFGQGVPLFTAELAADLELVASDKLSPSVILLHYKVQK